MSYDGGHLGIQMSFLAIRNPKLLQLQEKVLTETLEEK
jgi:hypothetical protein